MDLNKIKDIINSSSMTDELKQHLIVRCLAEDEQVMPLMLQILQEERIEKKKINEEMNRLLSMADVCLDDPKYIPGSMIREKIMDFYTKYKNKVGRCF